MSLPAEVEEEPREVLTQNQLSTDQAHIMPQLFGWLGQRTQRERSRYLTALTRGENGCSPSHPGPLGGLVEESIPGEEDEERENPSTTT